jgi:hypothetical protein
VRLNRFGPDALLFIIRSFTQLVVSAVSCHDSSILVGLAASCLSNAEDATRLDGYGLADVPG